ncbi:hypothetical protein [Ammoniphilus sp. YIM 78166]|uniref:hypothetical protein n=1 Tax=Ammoniphilus sp. YIM 78166 TaxID=1644106 RepID=UPI00106FF892|nr:hypothetical protein [Ammoniphilus sp. YIM 78166]
MKLLESFQTLFENAATEEEISELQQIVLKQGYAFVNEWSLSLRKQIELADGFSELDLIDGKIALATKILPNPHQLSPLWEELWTDMQFMIQTKKSLYEQVPETDQPGQWQLLFNNPYSTDGIVVHADLSFPQASYQFAVYRKDLAKHEYISLQKILQSITVSGE